MVLYISSFKNEERGNVSEEQNAYCLGGDFNSQIGKESKGFKNLHVSFAYTHQHTDCIKTPRFFCCK